MATQAQENSYLQKLNAINQEYLIAGGRLIEFDLKINTHRLWDVVKAQYPNNKIIPKANPLYEVFIKLGREIRTLEHQKEITMKAHQVLSQWNINQQANRTYKPKGTTCTDLFTMWEYRHQTRTQLIDGFYTEVDDMPARGYGPSHNQCKNLFLLELENAIQIDGILTSLKELGTEIRSTNSNAYTPKKTAESILSKIRRFHGIKWGTKHDADVARFMGQFKEHLGLGDWPKNQNYHVLKNGEAERYAKMVYEFIEARII